MKKINCSIYSIYSQLLNKYFSKYIIIFTRNRYTDIEITFGIEGRHVNDLSISSDYATWKLGKNNFRNPNIPSLDVSLMPNTRQNFTSFQRILPLFMFMSQISILKSFYC